MFLRILYVLFTILSLSSCSRLYVKLLTQKPKIESQQSITDFLVRNKFDTTNAYYLGGDINVANKILKDYYFYNVFDSLGNHLYNPEFICNFNYVTVMHSEHPDSLLAIHPGNQHIFSLMEGVKKLDGTPFDPSILANHKYYILVFWQKILGGKKGYKGNVADLVYELSKQKNILVLKINADMMMPPANASKTKFKVKLVNRHTRPFFQIR